MTSIDNWKVLVKQELYEAIAYFVERQALVAEAMRDLGLDLELVGQFGAVAWVSSVSHIVDGVEKLTELFEEGSIFHRVAEQAEVKRVPQIGTWVDDDAGVWKYFLHGGGCKLTNTATGEPIDWDCPDVLSFDPWKFRPHLEWQLDSPIRKGRLVCTADWVKENGLSSVEKLIREMKDEGLINQDYTLAHRGYDDG
jgi:hypothetical protein